MQHTVGIVDDERITRESLSNLVPWADLNLAVSFTATDGLNALEKMEELPVDILLSDVRMPHMNGIELAMNVRAKYPRCKIVFLSGYTDKEYLKSAITLKVEQYVEKPIEIEELKSVLVKIIEQLDHQDENLPNHGFPLSSLAKASRLIKQEIATELLKPQKGGYGFVHSRFYPLYFDWKEEGKYQVSCLHSHNHTSFLETLCGIMQDIEVVENSHDYMATDFGNGEIALITSHLDVSHIGLIKQSLELEMGETLSVGVSPEIHSIHQLPQGWKQAQKICSFWFYLQKGNILFEDTLSCKVHEGRPQLTSATTGLCFSSVQSIFLQLKEQRWSDIIIVKKELYAMYLKMMEVTINEDCLRFDDFAEYSLEEIQKLLLYGMHVFGTLGNDTYDPKVKETIHYILWHYMDQNLSIKVLADHADLSQNYLCSLFKQNTGTTINNVMMDVRIEKAKKLLRTSDLRLYEIANKVGMADPNYLSSMFKSRCGMTPSQYRDGETKEKE